MSASTTLQQLLEAVRSFFSSKAPGAKVVPFKPKNKHKVLHVPMRDEQTVRFVQQAKEGDALTH